SSSLVNLSARSAGSVPELVSIVQQRFGALARAHSLTLQAATGAEAGDLATTLHALLSTAIAPFENDRDEGRRRVTITGDDVTLMGSDVTNFALVLHELATNAAKHGALAQPDGQIAIDCVKDKDRLTITWNERMRFPKDAIPAPDGFGSFITRATIAGSL